MRNLGAKVTLICEAECRGVGVDFLAIENGNVVKMHYDAKIGNQVIDTSRNKEPLEFTVGEGFVIKGLDEAVLGLESGEKKTVVVPPEKAYGERKDDLTKEMARDNSDEVTKNIKKGDVVRFRNAQGSVQYATVTKAEEEKVTLDLNHPLAGQTLTFDLEIVEIKQNQ